MSLMVVFHHARCTASSFVWGRVSDISAESADLCASSQEVSTYQWGQGGGCRG